MKGKVIKVFIGVVAWIGISVIAARVTNLKNSKWLDESDIIDSITRTEEDEA